MFEFIAGLALGAAFSKFWLSVWEILKANVISRFIK